MMKNVKITMTFLVRNEEDIIEQNILYHHSQGIDSFIVMDNRSTDNTASIVRNLSRDIDIEYIYQSQDDYNQAEWVTEMARAAFFRHKADWVINNDADEFWKAASGSLKDFVASVPADVGVLRLQRHNAVLCCDDGDRLTATVHPEEADTFERLSVNNMGLPLLGKCIHRASGSVCVAQGNHSVDGIDGQIVDVDGAYILHYPHRSLEQYKQKIRLGGAAYNRNTTLPASMGATWREHYRLLETGEIDRFWHGLCRPRNEILIETLQGTFFRDRTVVDYLTDRRRQQDENCLRGALENLLERTNLLIDKFVESKVQFLMQFPEQDRRKLPLYYNLQSCINGPLRHREQVAGLQCSAPQKNLSEQFSMLRDIFSLFPQNDAFPEFLGVLLAVNNPDAVSRLSADCDGRPVVLHISCGPRRHLAERSVASFDSVSGDYHHIVVLGMPGSRAEDDVDLSLEYDGRTLIVPVPDDYESLHRKIFYTLTLLHLVANASCVIKVDDNLVLQDPERFGTLLSSVASGNAQYAGRLIGSERHHAQWHGWHISKCGNPDIEERGYQYPLPRQYAAGGYGYVLGKDGIAACAYMYLAMKEFFSMKSVGLEDAYVGHAMYAKGIELHNVATEVDLLALPGLANSDAKLS